MNQQKYYPAALIVHATSEQVHSMPRIYENIKLTQIAHVAYPEPADTVAQALRNLAEHLEETLRIEEEGENE